MFKVICIDALEMEHFLTPGEIYTVIDEFGKFYQLKEMPFNGSTDQVAGFYKRRFIPLSSISETEMIREYNHEPA